MTLQQIVAIVLLLSLMFGAGLQLDRTALVAVLKNVGLMVRALVASVVIVPLAALIFAQMFHLAQPIATGLALMALSPGVPFVVLSGGSKKGGSHELAVTLALLLPAISAITITVAGDVLLASDIHTGIPPSQLVGLIAFQLLPLVVGALVASYAPRAVTRLVRPVAVIMVAALIVLLAILAPTIFRSVVAIFGTFGMLAMLATALVSLGGGWLLGGRKIEYRRTLAMASLLRNPALALFIATTEFREPLVSSAVVTYFVVQFAVAATFGALVGRRMVAQPE